MKQAKHAFQIPAVKKSTFALLTIVALTTIAIIFYSNPVHDKIPSELSDSLVLNGFLDRLGCEHVNIARIAEFKTIENKTRLIHLTISPRSLSPFRKRLNFLESIIETLKRRHVILSGVKNLQYLETLEIRDIPLYEIPDEICALRNLSILDISGTEISKLPDSIGNIRSLVLLYFGRNNVEKIPESICKLNQLNALWVAGNPLKVFPNENCISPVSSIYVDAKQMQLLPTGLRQYAEQVGSSPNF